LAKRRAAMRTAIVEDTHLAVLTAQCDERLRADTANDEVAPIWNLTIVGDEAPAAVEDCFHLLREDGRIGVERAMKPPVLDKMTVIDPGWDNGCCGHHAVSFSIAQGNLPGSANIA